MPIKHALTGPIRVFAKCRATAVSRLVERYSLFSASVRMRAAQMARANAIAQSVVKQVESLDRIDARLRKMAADNLKPCRTPIDVLVHRRLQTMVLQPDAYRAPAFPCSTDLFPGPV